MAKVKFKFSVKEITFEYEGDHDTGLAVNRAMNHTLGSLVEAQNRVIDVTPEPPMPALPAAPAPTRRKHRGKPKATTNGQPAANAQPMAEGSSNGEPAAPKSHRQRRPHGASFRDQTYLLIREGYFGPERTATEIHAELSRRGHHFDPKNIASELLWFVQKHYLSRHHNADGKYAYVKGSNDDFPASQGGA